MLLSSVFIPVEKRVFELFGHLLHLPPQSVRLLRSLLRLVEQLLVAGTDLFELHLQHLLLTHCLLSLTLIHQQLLLVSCVLVR